MDHRGTDATRDVPMKGRSPFCPCLKCLTLLFVISFSALWGCSPSPKGAPVAGGEGEAGKGKAGRKEEREKRQEGKDGKGEAKTEEKAEEKAEEDGEGEAEAEAEAEEKVIQAAPRPRAREALKVPSVKKASQMYPWPRKNKSYQPLSKRLRVPAGFKRVTVNKGSYAHWLRHLPLRKKGTSVRDYSGRVLGASSAHSSAVVDLDVGKRDLQQCVDTLLRLRGEYLWWRGKKNKIAFRYAGGKYFGWRHWKAGLRPKRKRRKTFFKPGGRRGSSRKRFRAYLTFMFAMTGTMHHVREPRVKFKDMQAGDFFINPPPRSGALGHAVVILDLAKDAKGRTKALIGEGYTPAQDFHILKTPSGKRWYDLDPGVAVQTPQWPVAFKWKDLARFRY